jgi:hypothetical protein
LINNSSNRIGWISPMKGQIRVLTVRHSHKIYFCTVAELASRIGTRDESQK